MSHNTTIEELDELTRGGSDEFIYNHNEAMKSSTAYGEGERRGQYDTIGNTQQALQTSPRLLQHTSRIRTRKCLTVAIYSIAFVSFLALLAFFGYHYLQASTKESKTNSNNVQEVQKIQSLSMGDDASEYLSDKSSTPSTKSEVNLSLDTNDIKRIKFWEGKIMMMRRTKT